MLLRCASLTGLNLGERFLGEESNEDGPDESFVAEVKLVKEPSFDNDSFFIVSSYFLVGCCDNACCLKSFY